ncbi:hypothetical protein KAT51_01340 [bacterium]|nr:hypothetical protein [bacterium]
MAVGDPYQEFDILVKHKDAIGEALVTKGQVIKEAGNGFEPVSNADEGKFAIAMDTITALATDRDMRGLIKGIAEVTVAAASQFPVNFMDELICANAGEVKKGAITTPALTRSVAGYAMNTTALAASGTVPMLLK